MWTTFRSGINTYSLWNATITHFHHRLLAPWVAANAALVASQWQHRAWTVHLHPVINAEPEAGQTSITFFKSSVGMTRPGIEPITFGGACSTHCLPYPIQYFQTIQGMCWNRTRVLCVAKKGGLPLKRLYYVFSRSEFCLWLWIFFLWIG